MLHALVRATLYCLAFLSPALASAAGTPAGTTIENQATVVYTTPDSSKRHVVFGNRISFTIGQRAVTNLTPGSAAGTAGLGDSVGYPFVIVNSGNGADAFSLKTSSSLGLAAGIYRDINRDGLLNSDELHAGTVASTTVLAADSAEYFVVRLVVGDSAAYNGATDRLAVSAASLFDPARTAVGTYTTSIASASVTVTKGVSNPTPQIASRVQYTITCVNDGHARAQNVVVTDVLNPKLHFVTRSAAPAADTVAAASVTWKLGGLDPGARRTITFDAEVDESLVAGMVVHNVADVAYVDGDTRRSAVSAELSYITIAPGSSQTVTIAPGGAANAECGDTVAFPLTITNTGAVAREFALSAGSTAGVRWTFINDGNGNGRVDPGEAAATSSGMLDAGAQAHVVAMGRMPLVSLDQTVDTSLFIATSASNAANAAQCMGRTTIARPMMVLQKSADAASPAAGSEIAYTIVYRNSGHSSAAHFRVVDSIPANTSLVSGSIRLNSVAKTDASDGDEATVANGMLMIDLGTVAPGASGSIEFRVRID